MAKNKAKITELRSLLDKAYEKDKNKEHQWFARQLDIHPVTFSKKLKNNNWSKPERVMLGLLLKVDFEE